MGGFETVEKACHCEPVRAAKQVPLGYTLARQSVSKTHKFCAFRRFLPEKITDSHTSDIGHWFGMTGVRFIDTLKAARMGGSAFAGNGVYSGVRADRVVRPYESSSAPYSSISSWAICTALVAAPLRTWSPQHQMFRPLSLVRSSRIRPTNTRS